MDFLKKKPNRTQGILQKLRAMGQPVILFGAGLCGKQYLQVLEENGIAVDCFCDDDVQKQTSRICGYEVISLEQMSIRGGQIIISSYGPTKLYHRLQKLDSSLLDRVHLVDFYLWEKGLDYYQYFMEHEKEILQADSLLEDEKSHKVFRNLLQYKISRRPELIKEIQDSPSLQYVDESILRFGKEESFLDLGAYDGDTIRLFLHHVNGAYQKIVAVEPDPKNYRHLRDSVENMEHVECHSCGIAAMDGEAHFRMDSTWTSGMDREGSETIPVRSVDSLLHGERITFLKADIEGAEQEMIRGAENTIRSFHPQMAIAVYHKKEDIFEIVNRLHELYKGYKFYMRHYTEMPIDTVLYAVK